MGDRHSEKFNNYFLLWLQVFCFDNLDKKPCFKTCNKHDYFIASLPNPFKSK